MDLDHHLHKIQGDLKNKQRTVGDLNTLKKEKEEDLKKVVESLKVIVEDEEFNRKVKQKLFVLLFLNTDTDIYSDLKKSRKCAHLVGFFPKISRDLFFHIVVSLQLNQYLYESVQHFCSPMSYQVLNICLSALSWLDVFESVSFVKNLLISLFNKIVVMEENDKYNSYLKALFQRLLLHYDAEKGGTIKKMSSWKSSKMKHYAGLVMASLLKILENCTRVYLKKKGDSISSDNNLYTLQMDYDSVKLTPLTGVEGRLISVQQCYEHIVAKCLENVCSITIDIWLFWVEFDLDEIPDTENTLQRQIGECAYTCREALTEAEYMGISSKEASDLVSRLKNLALKPHTEEDLASSLDLSQILEKVRDPNKDTKKWLRFLLNKTNFAMEEDALEAFKCHVYLLQTVDVVKLSNMVFQIIKTNDNCMYHKRFVLEIMKSLDVHSQAKVSECFLENFGLSETLKTDDFQPLFIETFNKVIDEENKEKEVYPQLVSLALQSAETVVARAVAEGITSEVRGNLMADILGRLQPFCDSQHSDGNPLLVTVLDQLLLRLPDLPENQHVNYPLFVRELVMRKSLDGELFIVGCLMVKLHLHMKTKNCVILTACLETLSELFDIDCIHNCPASLVMLLQVVEAQRWSPSSFSMAAVRVCELALMLVEQFVTKWFSIGCEERQRKNMWSLVVKCVSPINRYHLYRLLKEEEMPGEPALQLLYRMHYGIADWSVLQIQQQQRVELVYSLCYVLPVLTPKEWQELFCVVTPQCAEFHSLFHIVTDSILLCIDSAKVNPDQTVISCLSFAILQVAQVVKCEVGRWTRDDNDLRISVLQRMCELVSSLPSGHQLSSGLSLVRVLQQLLPEGSRRKPLTAEEMNSVTASIASIQASEVRHSLAREFLMMVHR